MIRKRQNSIRIWLRQAAPLLAMLVFALLLTGCSIAETLLDTTDAPKATPGSAEIVVVSDAGQPLPSATPQTDAALPEDQVENDASSQNETTEPSALTTSPTTGRPLPEGAVYRPILAVIDNAAPSRPQTGLMLADIVYEFPLDRSDHSTRFLAVFSDEIPLKIGPIRTSRAYLANTALEWGGLYVSLGDPEEASVDYPLLVASGLRFRVQNDGEAASFFYRDKTITSIAEHTRFFKAFDYADANYSFSVMPSGNRFQFQSGVTYAKGKPFVSIGIPFTSSDSDRVVFTYDAATNRLTRRDKNSKSVLVESNTITPTEDVIGYVSEPISVQNLIVQYVRVSAYDTSYRNITVTGNGDCDFFISGRYVSGTWSRATLGDPTTYKLYDGSIIRLEPGNTWIEMMPNTREIKIRFSA